MPAPAFHRREGPTPERLSSVEDYLARKEEYDRVRDETVERVTNDLDHRIAKLESWKVEILVFVGATKIKWGAVSFVTAILSSALTAGVLKLFGLYQ